MNDIDKAAAEARRKYYAEYRQKNREKIRQQHAEWREKNREKLTEYQKNYWLRKAQE